MPEAIATTKRKFHKLLDTLTNYANAPAQEAVPSVPLTASEKLQQANDRVRKRRRVSDEVSISSNRSLASIATPRKIIRLPAKTDSEHKPLPNFSPWSQETFLDRLRTFSRVSVWHPKPEGINEIAWAKRGWRCVAVNTVACQGGCERRVLVKLDGKRAVFEDTIDDVVGQEEEEALEAALVERYKEQIIEGHDERCLWKKAGCGDDIYRLQIVRSSVWQPLLKTKIASLLEIAPSITNVKISDDESALGTMTKELPDNIFSSKDVPSALKEKALHIAMHGWQGSSELGSDLLTCDACFERIGLWMYQPDYKPKSTMPVSDDESDTSINLLTSHREHCPWQNAESQHASDSLAGLNATQILSQVVKTYLDDQRRKAAQPSDEVVDVVEEQEQPKVSREELARQDRERESRLQKLRRLLSTRRSVVNPARA